MTKTSYNRIGAYFFVIAIILFMELKATAQDFLPANVFAIALAEAEASAGAGEILQFRADEGNLVSKIAPGEFLPVSVKLTNFGAKQRVDVVLHYKIIDRSGKIITAAEETVAVETTASFIKRIQLPSDLPAGQYEAEASIIYEGQTSPAVSKFQFTVERKIAGLFQSQFLIYGALTLLLGIVLGIGGNLFMRRAHVRRLVNYDYSHITKSERLYYEIVSDIITQMRLHIGEKAIELAKNIDGLEINSDDGRVVRITKDPAKIVALIVLRYEKSFGKRLSFKLRREDEEARQSVDPIEKNLVVIRKYFE